MDNNQINNTTLPMAAFSQVPTPNGNAQQIVAIVKQKGRIAGYQLQNGQTVSKEQGVQMAKQGDIKGVGIAKNKGTEYLKSLPDGKESNNLSSLPTVQG